MNPERLAALVAQARTASAAGGCVDHPAKPVQPAFSCASCAADRKAAGDTDWLGRNAAIRAMATCDRQFPQRYRDGAAIHPDIWAWIAATVDNPAAGDSLLILGPVGRGKTFQAYGALRAVLGALPGLGWVAASFADFTASLRPRQGVDTEAEMERYRSAGVLLLDDIGAAKGSEWVEEVAYRLIDHRYNLMLPTIYATNLLPGTLRDVLGDRIASRLAETCRRVVLDGPDLRRGRP
jgi:DNA replication protein DnaC